MPKYVVLSRALWLDLCDGDDIIASEIAYFSIQRGYILAITPTMGHSLVDMANVDRNPSARLALLKAASSQYGIVYPTLDPENRDGETHRVKNGLADFAAKAIVERLKLPDRKRNVALILAEAAIMRAAYVILESDELRDITIQEVNSVLQQHDLPVLRIFPRRTFYRHISGKD